MSDKGSLTFCNIRTTYVVQTEPEFGPEIRLYGRLPDGRPILAKCQNFYPYFYVQQQMDVLELHRKLSLAIPARDKPPLDYPLIRSIEPVRKTIIMGYRPGGPEQVYKITMGSPKWISVCRKIFENAGIATYEASILYILRFLVDVRIGGFDWVQISEWEPSYSRTYHAEDALEVVFKHENLTKLENGKFQGVSKYLAFDIEACRFNKRGFVDPKEDPVTQISCDLFLENRYQVLDKRVFSLVPPGKKVAPLPDPSISVEIFEDEGDLLIEWARYVHYRDPDCLVTFNGDGFDWPYLYNRAFALGVQEEFCRLLSRDSDRPAILRKASFQSKGKGARRDFEMVMEGRFGLDVHKYFKDTKKLRSYGLGAIANQFLKHSKVELPHYLIPTYQMGTDEQRAHLCYYCYIDAALCRELLEKEMVLVVYIESARVCGVPFDFFLTRGQQILTISLLLRFAGDRAIIIPSSPDIEKTKTKGAIVKNPAVGFYPDEFIVTLDFQSLYPSIIRDRNICYCTKVKLDWARKHLSPADYWIPPIPGCNFCYVKEHIITGILSEMETTLFNKRNEAKAEMKNEKDRDRKEVFNQKQTAIKVRMNSIYGFMKSDSIIDNDLMETVTAEGRLMLETTTQIVETNFPGSKVIYGDTDSVFISFGKGVSFKRAFELGEEAAKMCSEHFKNGRQVGIHLLQREKLFENYLLAGKKKYAGKKYLNPTSEPELSTSGIETVRRDNAKVASELLDKCLENMIMGDDQSGKNSIKLVHQTISNLLMGRVEYSKLIITKGLSKTPEQYAQSATKQPHVELCKKIDARKHITGEAGYATGDRVRFVFISGTKNSKTSENAEDPMYALRNRSSIDFRYYLTRQLMKPLLRVFTPILAPSEKLKKINKKGDKVPLTDKELEPLTAYKVLFTGPHMTSMVQKVSQTSVEGIAKFTVIIPKCLYCGVQMRASTEPLCRNCAPHKESVKATLEDEMTEYEGKYADCWGECARCVGTTHKAEDCSNQDCDNFFARTKVQIDMEDLMKKLNRF
jgi:DNA polymerase delta subunit 1